MKNWSLIVIILLLAACAPVGVTPGTTPGDDSLAGTQWELESFGPPGNEAPLVEGSQVTLIFEEGGQAGGNGGCNSYGAQYREENDVLSIQEIVSTLMACADQRVTEQEGAYFRALESAERYERMDGRLVISSGQAVLNFVEINP
jgi:heat shock protein HslJ